MEQMPTVGASIVKKLPPPQEVSSRGFHFSVIS